MLSSVFLCALNFLCLWNCIQDRERAKHSKFKFSRFHFTLKGYVQSSHFRFPGSDVQEERASRECFAMHSNCQWQSSAIVLRRYINFSFVSESTNMQVWFQRQNTPFLQTHKHRYRYTKCPPNQSPQPTLKKTLPPLLPQTTHPPPLFASPPRGVR